METDTEKSTELHVQLGDHWSLKICQPIYIDHIDALHKVDFYEKKASQCRHFKVKLKQTSVFLDFSKLIYDGN